MVPVVMVRVFFTTLAFSLVTNHTSNETLNHNKKGEKKSVLNILVFMLLVLKTVKIVSKQVFLCVIKVMLAHLTPESRDPRTAIYEEKELEREKGKEHNVIKE